MTCNARAHACIGVLVPRSKLYHQAERRGCGHPLSREASGVIASHCVHCGAPLWLVRSEPIDGYDPEQGTLWGLHCKQVGADVCLVSPVVLHALVGDDCEESSVHLPLADDAVMLARKRLREALEPLGLWDRSAFGLWCCAEVSA